MDEKREKLIDIDLCNITTSRELQILLKEKLEFPDFYGYNWDSFWDAITGLVELPEKIIFRNWHKFKISMPQDADYLNNILNKFNEEYPKFKTKLEFL